MRSRTLCILTFTIILILVAGCKGTAISSRAEQTTLSPGTTLTVLPSASSPTATLSPTPIPTFTATPVPTPPTLTPTPTLAPLITPVIQNTPIPTLALQNFKPENLIHTQLMATWGDGVITALAWSPDGDILAVASPEGVHLYNRQDAKKIGFFQSYGKGWINDIAFSPDGSVLAVADSDAVCTWTINDMKVKQCWTIDKGNATSLAFSPDGNYLVVGIKGEGVYVTDLQKELSLWVSLPRQIRQLKFSPDGSYLGALVEERCAYNLFIYSWQDQSLVLQKEGVGGGICGGSEGGFGFTLHGEVIFYDLNDVIVESISSGKQVATYRGPWFGNIFALAVSADGKVVAAGRGNYVGSLIWRYGSSGKTKVLKGGNGSVTKLALSADGKWLATSGPDGFLYLWNTTSGQLIRKMNYEGWRLPSLQFVGNEYLVGLGEPPVGSGSRNIYIRRVSNGEYLPLAIPIKWVWDIGFPRDGHWMAVVGEEQKASVRDFPSGVLLRELPTWEDYKVAVSPSGNTVATTGWGPQTIIALWDARSTQRKRLLMAQGRILSLSFSSDDRLIAAGGYSDEKGWMGIWDSSNGQMLYEWHSTRDEVSQILFHPFKEEVYLLVENEIKKWDLEHETQPTKTGWQGSAMTLSPDGRLLVVLDASYGTVFIDTDKQKPLGYLPYFGLDIAFSKNGTMLAISGLDGRIYLFGVGEKGGGEYHLFGK